MNNAIKEFIQNTIKGIGSGVSATKGAPIVIIFEQRLTILKTVVMYFVGNSLDTDIYPILKDIDAPILHRQTRKGISHNIWL